MVGTIFCQIGLCQCGCNRPTTLFRGKYRRYITGHYSYTDQHKKISSERHRNEKNFLWKGDKVTYNPLHAWIRVRKPKPELCEQCNSRRALDLSNISHQYKRDIADYRWLCRSCHMLYDGSSKGREPWNKGIGTGRLRERDSKGRFI